MTHFPESSLDPYLRLLTLGGDVLETDDAGGSDNDAKLIYTFDESATVIIEASRYGQESGSTSGVYNLEIACADGARSS